MAIPIDEEIKRWRERWEKYPGLSTEILTNLRMINNSYLSGTERIEGMTRVQHMLLALNNEIFTNFENVTVRGFELDPIAVNPLFDGLNDPLVQDFAYRVFSVPVLDLRGIYWHGQVLSDCNVCQAVCTWNCLQAV